MKDKLWLLFILITIVTWGIWGAFSDLQMDRDGIPETVVYILWAASMLPCAIVALCINKGKFMCDWKSALLGCTVGLLGAGGQLVLFKALAIGPAYIIFPFISMSPVIVISLAALFLKEKANRWQIAGIIMALAAILLLSLQSGGENGPVSGWLWIVLAVLVLLAWGIQGFFMKFANNSMDAESIFIWMAVSAIALIPVAWFMQSEPMTAPEFFAGADVTAKSLKCFGIQSLNSIGALTLVYAYRYGKAVIVSPMEGLSPMVTVLLSLIILAVIPTPLQIAGICCAAFAMYALSK